nr:hypothetical protein [Tanacetum cinerariifolium]
MLNLTFADTHNMIVFLSKSDASAGFDQIVDFLNGQVIQYALMVNPTIYVSCIKQFWAMVSIKKVNNVVKLRALIDGKRVVVTEDVIRHDLRLDDADSVDCLSNEEIFTELARMGYEKPPLNAKRTTWNEFSCSMASAVICFATGREFNFYTYIFDGIVRNVDIPSKFLMYPWFLQVMINAQVDDLSSHTNQYTSLAITQKVFANMRKVGKGFSGVETPLFATMLVQPQPPAAEEENEVETCATLFQKVAHLEQDKIAQALEIIKLKIRLKKLEKKRRSKSLGLKRLRKAGTSQRVESSTKNVMGAQEDASKQEKRIEAIDADEEITLVDMETQVDLGAELQERNDDDNAAAKEVNDVAPTVFDDEEVTMNMAQTLIKMKAVLKTKIMIF